MFMTTQAHVAARGRNARRRDRRSLAGHTELAARGHVYGTPSGAAIKDAVTTRNPEALRAAAHALKGAAGNLSATRLSAAADVLERIGAAARMDAAAGAWRQLSVESSELMDLLRGTTVPPANEALSCVS